MAQALDDINPHLFTSPVPLLCLSLSVELGRDGQFFGRICTFGDEKNLYCI